LKRITKFSIYFTVLAASRAGYEHGRNSGEQEVEAVIGVREMQGKRTSRKIEGGNLSWVPVARAWE